MSEFPVVSVITPTKNRCKLLCEAIDSVQQQTFGGWEHIIVDDASEDGTREEVTRRAAADPRIRYIPRVSEGSGANICRNIGVSESRTELGVFLDSDDLLRPHCLARRVEFMRQNPVLDFTVFRGSLFRKSIGDLNAWWHPMTLGDDLLRFLSHECVWQTSGPIWRLAFLKQIGCFDEALPCMQDLELHVRALSASPKYLCFQDVDHDIRTEDDGKKISVRYYNDPAYFEAAERVHDKLLETVTDRGLLTSTRRRALLGLKFALAEFWLRRKHVIRAVRVWNRGCAQQRASVPLQVMGLFMLFAAKLGTRWNSVGLRIVAKWKGRVRFRAEL